jgi:helicase SWR1
MNGHSYPGSARKKRRLLGDDVSSMPPPPTIPNGRSSKRLRDNLHQLSVSADPRTRSTMNGHSSTSTRASRHPKQQSVSYAGHASSVSPTKSGITRIKLIVRAPPPLISHPRQRPPVPRFESLDKFLSSYTTYNDQDLTEEALEEIAKTDSIILDRIDNFRRQGRLLLPDLDSESGSGLMSTATGTTHKRGPDIWDQVVDEVVARARVKRNGNGIGGRGRQIASQIASRVHGYWDGHALREDKAKAQEERRLRALAKATIKMVTGEWKKAVFVRFSLLSTHYTVVLIYWYVSALPPAYTRGREAASGS